MRNSFLLFDNTVHLSIHFPPIKRNFSHTWICIAWRLDHIRVYEDNNLAAKDIKRSTCRTQQTRKGWRRRKGGARFFFSISHCSVYTLTLNNTLFTLRHRDFSLLCRATKLTTFCFRLISGLFCVTNFLQLQRKKVWGGGGRGPAHIWSGTFSYRDGKKNWAGWGERGGESGELGGHYR